MQIGRTYFHFGSRYYVMGILNLTPDSFSDGGFFAGPEKALERALKMIEEGADLIDIGGESTRPGAKPVPAEEEIRRVLPVLRKIRSKVSIPISIDTQKASVAKESLEEGADLINDVSAASDPEMKEVLKKWDCPSILMHRKGTPETMQQGVSYQDPVGEIRCFLRQRIESLVESGVRCERLLVDPGIGFGKRFEDNRVLLKELGQIKTLERPVVVGVSRKSFLGRISGREISDRLIEGLGASFYAALQGADILRVHDVAETKRILRVLEVLSFGSISDNSS